MKARKIQAIGGLIAAACLVVFALVPAIGAAAPNEAPSAAAASEEGSTVTPASTQDESCEQGLICVWTGTSYSGVKGQTLCSNGGRHPLGGEKGSLKNRCANKKVYTPTGSVCVNPQNNAGALIGVTEIVVGAEGSRC